MLSSNKRLFALIAIIVVLGALALGGLRSVAQSLTGTHDVVSTLQYNASRGDCIRQVTADADQEFRQEIASLFDAGRDPKKIEAVRVRMRSQPNYADTVQKVCPPATKENP